MIRFERLPSGRELAMKANTCIGDIIPCASGRGGWVTVFEHAHGYLPDGPRWVRTREDARAILWNENSNP